ncbi:hypothetical protein MKW94_016877 [Papaver nudicaule]|uniref:Fungal lipase-like domain-containing protein n=1 Tax=Papaver nudicaule TaxID=74823 RepID=A0AA42APX7_PAPNU|nr:hypothetical protein [Papaver nudicaule]
MIGIAIAQRATATTILSSPQVDSSSAADAVIRHERRMRYKRWLRWTRFGMVITVLQFFGASYLMIVILQYFSQTGKSSWCFLDPNHNVLERKLLVAYLVLVWFLVIIQCMTGSDVLRWRSFYATHDSAWKAHYHEVFDHGIREVLCCLGRVKYLSVLEEDEVYSVARLLGDLVAYRASGTGHLELLAGLALLQRQRPSESFSDDLLEAPEEMIREAASLHQFAEAAYTGPLLDFGRNPILFPCAWLYRQGVVTPWTRNRRPVLGGDNWWRGHAAAFLKYVNLSPESLRQGRVCQGKCEAAYFVVVLHHLRSVVIAVRGTETPEDLITDGLCRECTLSEKDLDGLISNNINPDVKQRVLSSFPHYGHSGIVETARELFMQIDGVPESKDNEATGFLTSLMGPDCECHGYSIRIVGHSLGGSISALLGIRLYGRFPNLHVYSYGPLPCVDSIVADACSDFVTSIVYNDEFSARLSVNSILRLRGSAITALSEDSAADSAMIFRLARRVLQISSFRSNEDTVPASTLESETMTPEDSNHYMYRRRHYKYVTEGSAEQDQQFPASSVTDFTENQDTAMLKENTEQLGCYDTLSTCTSACSEVKEDVITCEDPVSEFMNAVPSSDETSAGDPPEMYLPGVIILMLPKKKSFLPIWGGWKNHERDHAYRAYLANKESFKDIIVSPFMFLDHLPWRCHYALQKVLETRQAQSQQDLSSLV